MDNAAIQKKCHELLKEFGQPSFVVFGWKKDAAPDVKRTQFGVVYAQHKMPKHITVKCMSWALNDIIQKML